jgi:CRISPR-associated protein Cmr2
MQEYNTYFALTIGPIYKTLAQAQRTREFWGSSYLFSWIMREVILGMIAEKTITEDEILMPHRNRHNINLKVGTGLYHDRMIVQISSNKKDKVLDEFKTIADTVLGKIATITKIDLAVLQSYFRLNAVLFDLEDGENIVETVTNYLDSLELQNPIFHEAWKIDWPSVIADLNGALFYSDAFSRGSDFDFVFDSIPEITTRGLRTPINKDQNKEEIESRYDYWVKEDITAKLIQEKKEKKRLKSKEVIKIQDTFIDDLSKDPLFKDAFRNYHKYIAIVHADGDNFGKTISNIGVLPEEVKNLSKLLFNFAKDAAKAITMYGGTNVYAGGDDLLFFAPVATVNNNGNQTIFDLINNLDDHFKTTVCDKLTKIAAADRPTLSWGVSISYYKFPLSEAIVSSRNLLFNEAKSYKGKNAVAFKLIKHTGQFFGATFGKEGRDYKFFTKLLKDKFNTETDFISSLQYRISDNQTLLTEILRIADKVERETRVANFFDNFFDEEIHSNKKDFIHSVRDMLTQAFTDSMLPGKELEKMKKEEKEESHKNSVKTAIDKTYSALRFIHFLNSKSDE